MENTQTIILTSGEEIYKGAVVTEKKTIQKKMSECFCLMEIFVNCKSSNVHTTILLGFNHNFSEFFCQDMMTLSTGSAIFNFPDMETITVNACKEGVHKL